LRQKIAVSHQQMPIIIHSLTRPGHSSKSNRKRTGDEPTKQALCAIDENPCPERCHGFIQRVIKRAASSAPPSRRTFKPNSAARFV